MQQRASFIGAAPLTLLWTCRDRCDLRVLDGVNMSGVDFNVVLTRGPPPRTDLLPDCKRHETLSEALETVCPAIWNTLKPGAAGVVAWCGLPAFNKTVRDQLPTLLDSGAKHVTGHEATVMLRGLTPEEYFDSLDERGDRLWNEDWAAVGPTCGGLLC
jgi:hypothetical protein